MAARRRDHLVETALRLFNEGGYHATGIDKILAEAGCAKMTLYNHFESKDDLILAALKCRDERFRETLRRRVETRAEAPRARLLAVFDVLGEWMSGPDFHGCMFINAAAEYGDPGERIHAAAAEHKRQIYDWVRGLCAQAGAKRPGELAAQLLLLADGAIVNAQLNPSAPAARQAKKAATVLIEAALGS